MATPAENLRGAALMMIAMGAYTINDALMKTANEGLALYQSIFLRGLAATLLLGIFAWSQGAFSRPIPRRDRRWVALRVGAEMGGTVTFLTALMQLPLASVTAVLQVTPLAVTLAAALAFREPLGWRRFSAILVAFGGVLVILRPWGAGFDTAALWALVAVGFIVVRDLATRRLSAEVPSLQVAFLTAGAICVTGAGLLPLQAWEPVSRGDIALLLGAAIAILCGYVASVATMRVGEVAFVAPFRYTAIVWGVVLGIVVLGERPDAWTLIGAAIVVAMGLYAFFRERRLARSTFHPPGNPPRRV
ncbi:MAG: DMT family transporter [Rubricella sp.]